MNKEQNIILCKGDNKIQASLVFVNGTNGLIRLMIGNKEYGTIWNTRHFGIRFAQDKPRLYSEDITELIYIVKELFIDHPDYPSPL